MRKAPKPRQKYTSSRVKNLKSRRVYVQVSRTKILAKSGPCGTESLRICKYSDVPFCRATGYTQDLKYLPIDFDLVMLKVKGKQKPVAGWWDGEKWCGLRFKPEYEVTAWRRVLYD